MKLLVFVYYSTNFVTKNAIINVVFHFKYSAINNDDTIFEFEYQFLCMIFDVKKNFIFYNQFSF